MQIHVSYIIKSNRIFFHAHTLYTFTLVIFIYRIACIFHRKTSHKCNDVILTIDPRVSEMSNGVSPPLTNTFSRHYVAQANTVSLPYDQARYPFALNPYTRIKASNSVHVQGKRSRICWWCTWPARRASWSCLLTPKFARYRCTIATRRQRPPARPASPSRIHIAPGTPRRICVWPCRPSCTTATPTKPSSRTL